MTDLLRTEAALDECRSHVGGAALAGSPIEAYLARYLAVVLCAEIEEAIRDAIWERVDNGSTDAAVGTLIRNITRNFVKNATHAEVKSVVGRLGPEFGERYDLMVREFLDDDGFQSLATLVRVRDQVAHRTPPAVTLAELEVALATARHLVGAVKRALTP